MTDQRVHKAAVLLVFLAGAVGLIVLGRTHRAEAPAVEGYFAPEFTLPRLDGGQEGLSDNRGKVVLVNIWASWCKPCVEEIPSLEALYRMEKDKGFEILAVSIDKGAPDAVRDFVREHRVSFPVLLDPSGSVGRLYGITGVPESFLVGKKGMIIEKVIGPRAWNRAESVRMIERLLGREV